MDGQFWLPLLVLASSLLPGIAILALREEQHRLRTLLNMLGASTKPVLVALMAIGVAQGRSYEARFPLFSDIEFVLRADPLSLLFAGLSATLWFLTTIYAIGYLEGAPDRSRFFGFFSLCVTSTMGIALAGNLVTFLLFYEMLTVVTYPMVVHRGTPRSLEAGRTYLLYTVGGGTLLLIAVVWLHVLAGPVEFTPGGALASVEDRTGELTVLFAFLIASLGVKAALVPLHSWLPVAMVAPAPVSALLHAVAVVKAGAFGIVRVVYNIYGVDLATTLGVLTPLAAAAAVTIGYGSVLALAQDDLKRRLAFSTVSQLSYIVLAVALATPLAAIAALVHLVHQGIMKVTLFYCAGSIAETVELRRISELDGIGTRMPVTFTAFTIAACGMIGLPPTAGFVSKWYLGMGSLQAGDTWVIAVLGASSLLNAMYFLPVLHRGWFLPPQGPWTETHPRGRLETHWMLLVPTAVTALLVVLMGLLANTPFGPLFLADLVIGEGAAQ